MNQKLWDVIEASPVIAAIKDMDGLEACCASKKIKVVFILFGDVCSIGTVVARLKEAGKTVMVHVDLIAGLSGKEVAVDYIKEFTQADGIISTKPPLIRRARELSLYSALRLFALDSMALENIVSQTSAARPDMIEILPGIIPKVIHKVCGMVRIPVIAGGLISDKEDVMAALSAGAVSISASSPLVWQM